MLINGRADEFKKLSYELQDQAKNMQKIINGDPYNYYTERLSVLFCLIQVTILLMNRSWLLKYLQYLDLMQEETKGCLDVLQKMLWTVLMFI